MAIDYGAIAASAAAAIADAGQQIAISVPGAGTYSPTTGAVTSTPAAGSAFGVVLPPGSMIGSGFTFGPDVLVRAEALIYLAADTFAATPKPGATVTEAAGRAWRVIGADTLAPAGLPVLHALAVVAT